MLKTARLIITGILLTGQLLSCRERPENPYVVTTTEQHPWVEAPVGIPSSEAVDAELVLNLAETGQTVEGFGMCFSELSFRALSRLSAEDYEAVMDELFAPGEGMNFTVCRTPIGASDFALKYYSYDDTPGDLSMEHFTIDNDRETLIPLIKDALKRNPSLRIWGSPWCPPSWMKVNRHYACRPIQGFPSRGKSLKLGNVIVDNGLTPGQVMHEGEDSFLQEEAYFEAYARYFQKYIRAYRDEGVDIFMVMPQNEFNSDQNFPSCTWTAKGLTRFLRHLVPAMESEGVEVFFRNDGTSGPLPGRYDPGRPCHRPEHQGRRFPMGRS